LLAIAIPKSFNESEYEFDFVLPEFVKLNNIFQDFNPNQNKPVLWKILLYHTLLCETILKVDREFPRGIKSPRKSSPIDVALYEAKKVLDMDRDQGKYFAVCYQETKKQIEEVLESVVATSSGSRSRSS
jgi:hypothetical protein